MKKLLLLLALFCVIGIGAYAQIQKDTVITDTLSSYLPLSGGQLTGALTFSADDTHDIGASGATRPRDIYAARDIFSGGKYYGTDSDSFIEVLTNAVTLFANSQDIIKVSRSVGLSVRDSDVSNIVWEVDGSGDIGASSTTNRPDNVHAKTGMTIGGVAVPTISSTDTLTNKTIPDYLPLVGGTLTGALLFTDNLYDIGASGATRPRNIYVAGNYYGTDTDSYIDINSNAVQMYGNGSRIATFGSGTTGLRMESFDIKWNTDGGGNIGASSSTNRPDNVHAKTGMTIGGVSVPIVTDIATLVRLLPKQNEPPASNFATIDLRNSHPVLDFDDTTNESAVFTFIMPQNYDGGGITVYIHYAFTTAITGDVDWDAAIERIGDQGQDLDSDGFAAVNSVDTTTVPGTSGLVDVVSIAFTDGADMDSCAKGDLCRIKITRDATNDTGSGDAELVAAEIRN